MRAVVLDGAGGIFVRDLPEPRPAPGEALVQVRWGGICGTDLRLASGYMGFSGIPGHEFVGEVISVSSPADAVLVGCRVAGEINVGCRECRLCSEGLARHCPRRRVLGILGLPGAFAQRLTLPVDNLKVVPDLVSDRAAVFIEPLAAAFEILDQVGLRPGQRVLVLGDGRLGLLCGQVLAGAGCDVTLAGRHDSKLALARSLGLRALRLDETEPEDGHELVVEATGSERGLDDALARVRPRGVVVMKSTCAGRIPFEAWKAVVNEVTLIGSRCGRFEPAIEALAQRRIAVEPLVTEELPLEDAAEAFSRAGRGESIKVLLRAAA